MKLVTESQASGKTVTGLFYQAERPTLLDRLGEIQVKAAGGKEFDINKVLDLYQP